MGKNEGNTHLNASLSYTLEHLTTEVILELSAENDTYINQIGLEEAAVARFMKHLAHIKKIYGCSENFLVTSRNNFPHSSGIASSASSFAALTLCAVKAICDLKNIDQPTMEQISSISRIGSGSSCRSFFSPWCLWTKAGAEKIDIKVTGLLHDLAVIDINPKKTASSRAHKLVETSLLMDSRPERTAIRLKKLIQSLNKLEWSSVYQLCWEEFWDMLALFETSNPGFGYLQPDTLRVLYFIREFWEKIGDGPIVTMDAGPNVHLLWRADQSKLRSTLKATIGSRFLENAAC
jgi:diphosphomevalonate decarboxylase